MVHLSIPIYLRELYRNRTFYDKFNEIFCFFLCENNEKLSNDGTTMYCLEIDNKKCQTFIQKLKCHMALTSFILRSHSHTHSSQSVEKKNDLKMHSHILVEINFPQKFNNFFYKDEFHVATY